MIRYKNKTAIETYMESGLLGASVRKQELFSVDVPKSAEEKYKQAQALMEDERLLIARMTRQTVEPDEHQEDLIQN